MNRHPRTYDAWRDALLSPKSDTETKGVRWKRVAYAMLAHAEVLEGELADAAETGEDLDTARQSIADLERDIGELQEEVDRLEAIIENRREESR